MMIIIMHDDTIIMYVNARTKYSALHGWKFLHGRDLHGRDLHDRDLDGRDLHAVICMP